MHADLEWKGKLKFDATSGSGHTVTMDGVPEVGGENEGPRPMEVLLMAVGGCAAMDVIAILQKMRVQVDSFNVRVEGDQAEDHPKVFTAIRMTYKFKGPDVPEDKAMRAVDKTHEKYCSAIHMVNKAAVVDYRIEIEKA